MGPLVLVMLKKEHYWFLLFYESISLCMFYIPHSDTCM